MKWLNKLWTRITTATVLIKLMISLFIVVIPLYTLNYAINELGSSTSRSQITSSMLNSVQSHHSLLETDLNRLQNMLKASAIDIAHSHVGSLQADVPYMVKLEFIADVKKQMNRIRYSSLFIENTNLHVPSLNLNIALENEAEYDQATYQALTASRELFTHWQGGLYMTVPYTFSAMDNNGLFVLSLKIVNKQLQNFLSNMVNYEHDVEMLFHLDENWDISTLKDRNEPMQHIQAHIRQVVSTDQYDTKPTLETLEIGGNSYVIVYDYSSTMGTIIAAYAPESEVFSSLQVYREYFWLLSFLSVLVIIIFSLWTYKTIHKPIRRMVMAFRKVETGYLQYTMNHHPNDEFGYLYRRFNEMVGNLKYLIQSVYEQKLFSQRSELKRLQSQINPHFLYNNFFVLQRLIHMNQNKRASEFTGYLSRYFQFVTRDAADDIELKTEMEHAMTFIEIQSICLDNRVEVMIEPLPRSIEHLIVPRLIIQPILENSYKYAFEHMVAGGQLQIRFMEDPGLITIHVEDNGKELTNEKLEELQGMLAEPPDSGIETTGVLNVHRRLQLKFGERSGLTCSRGRSGGLKVAIRIQTSKE